MRWLRRFFFYFVWFGIHHGAKVNCRCGGLMRAQESFYGNWSWKTINCDACDKWWDAGKGWEPDRAPVERANTLHRLAEHTKAYRYSR